MVTHGQLSEETLLPHAQSCLYKIVRTILEKYPTLSRVWVGKYCPRVVKSIHVFCVSPGSRVLAFWLNAQKRLKGEFLLPEYVTKWGKVLISLNPFCKRYALRASRQPYPVQTRFPKLDFLLRANRRETADKRPALASAEITGIPSARTNLHARAHDRGSVLKLGTHLRKPFLVQIRFPREGFLLRV